MTEASSPDPNIPPDRFVDPLAYRAVDAKYDADRAGWDSSFMGDQLAREPNGTVFLAHNGRLIDKEHYLVMELTDCVEILRDVEQMPEAAKRYYQNSEAFKNIFAEDDDELTKEQLLARTENFLIEHGKFCTEKLGTMHERIEEYKQDFSNAVLHAVEEGHLPASAAENLQMLEKLSFSVTDLDSLGEGDGLLGGFYDADKQNVAASIFLNDDELREVMFHELTHAISGHAYVEKFGGYITSAQRVGLSKSKADKEPWMGWLNEALTEHITRGLMYGGFDKITPRQREEAGLDQGQNVYYQERNMLGGIIEASEGRLQLNDLLAVYFQHQKEGDTGYVRSMRNLVRNSRPFLLSTIFKSTDQALLRHRSGESFDEIFGPGE